MAIIFLCKILIYLLLSGKIPKLIGYLFFSKTECDADAELNRVFKILSTQENDIVRPRIITHLGRDLKFDKTCGQILFSTFDDLCNKVIKNS